MSLITKLDSSVSDSSLTQLGAFTITSKAVENATASDRVCGIAGSCELTIVGDPTTCYFTDNTLTQNQGQTKIINSVSVLNFWVSNAACKIIVKPKYEITFLILSGTGVYLDADGMKQIGYMVSLEHIQFYSLNTAGDISVLKTCSSIRRIDVNPDIYGSNGYWGITGDADELVGLPLEYLDLHNTSVKATLSKLASIPTLKYLRLGAVNDVSGNVSSFIGKSNITNLRIGALRQGDNTKITGNITDLGDLVNATEISVGYTAVVGTCDDLAAALAAAGKTSGTVSITQADGTNKSFTFPLT